MAHVANQVIHANKLEQPIQDVAISLKNQLSVGADVWFWTTGI